MNAYTLNSHKLIDAIHSVLEFYLAILKQGSAYQLALMASSRTQVINYAKSVIQIVRLARMLTIITVPHATRVQLWIQARTDVSQRLVSQDHFCWLQHASLVMSPA